LRTQTHYQTLIAHHELGH